MSKVTIFLPITRKSRVDDMIKQINSLETGNNHINCLIIVDNNEINTNNIRDGIRFPVEIVSTGNKPPSENNVQLRRERITKVWELAKQYMPFDTDFILALEDDCKIMPHYLMDLLADYEQLKNLKVDVGLVSGVQAGRWGYKIIGAWLCDDANNPVRLRTVPYQNKMLLTKVDATGFYFMLVSRDCFMEVTPTFGDFGPDVYFGLGLRKLGYVNVIDWSVKVGHVTQIGILQVDKECVSLTYEKKDGEWKIIKAE